MIRSHRIQPPSGAEIGNAAYVLMGGEAKIPGGRTVVARIESGTWLGKMALIEKLPCSASVRPATPCKLIAIEEPRFNYQVQRLPFFALQVMKIMAERLRNINAKAAQTKAP